MNLNIDTRPARFAACAFFACALLTNSNVQAAADCPEFSWMGERLNYTAGRDQKRISEVETHHFDVNTEGLVRGVTGTVGGDLDFVVRYSPNHHRALAAMVRLALRDKTPQPRDVHMPVECYLLRAIEFTPNDPEVHKIFGTYLARLNRDAEALTRFEQAEKLAPDDPVIAYNIGLLLADRRDFERSRAYAKKAYAAGIQFPGLRDKLTRMGQWR